MKCIQCDAGKGGFTVYCGDELAKAGLVLYCPFCGHPLTYAILEVDDANEQG